jgi:ankyrin repeat protein
MPIYWNEYIRVNTEKNTNYRNSYKDFKEFKNIGISDIPIMINEEPNILLYAKYMYDENRVDFENIYPTVRILVTEKILIDEDKYLEIPSYIEKIIILNLEYDIKDEFEMIQFMSNERLREYVKNNIDNDRIMLEYNKNNDNIFGEICARKDSELIKYIVEKRKNIINEIIDKFGSKNIFGSYYNDVIIRIIIENMDKKYLYERDEYNRTILQLLIYVYNMNTEISFLIDDLPYDLLVMRDNEGNNSLFYACKYQVYEVANKLIERMEIEDINYENNEGYTVYYYMIIKRMVKTMEKAVEKINTINVNKKIFHNITILEWSVIDGHNSIVKKIIGMMDRKIIEEIEIIKGRDRYSILSYYCYIGDEEMAKIMIENGIRKIKKEERKQILYYVLRNNMKEIEKYGILGEIIDNLSIKEIDEIKKEYKEEVSIIERIEKEEIKIKYNRIENILKEGYTHNKVNNIDDLIEILLIDTIKKNNKEDIKEIIKISEKIGNKNIKKLIEYIKIYRI